MARCGCDNGKVNVKIKTITNTTENLLDEHWLITKSYTNQ